MATPRRFLPLTHTKIIVFPRIQPINPTRIAAPFDHPDFLFELKHDGFRAVAYISAGKCELVSRRDNVYKSFERLREALASVHLTDAILDGEIVYLDSEGRRVFKDVMHRRGDPIFYAFDFLWLNGAQMISEAPDPAICNYSPPRIPVVPYVSTDV